MDSHAPADDVCPFCRFAKGDETPANTQGDIVYQDDEVMAFVAPRWWPENHGNLIVIPKLHYENLYSIPDDLLSRIILLGKRLAIAMKEVYGCDGTSLRQHNEPGGGQDVFHFHLHVLPRYFDDRLYQRTDEHRFASADERRPYAQKLRAFLYECSSPQDTVATLKKPPGRVIGAGLDTPSR